MRIKELIVLAAGLCLTAACQESLEERCKRECYEFTSKKCPMRIDAYTLMDSMTFDAATRTISYAYTLSGMLDDSAYIQRANPRELLLGEVRNSANLKLYKDAKYSFRYVYHSDKQKDTQLFETTFNPEDYQ